MKTAEATAARQVWRPRAISQIVLWLCSLIGVAIVVSAVTDETGLAGGFHPLPALAVLLGLAYTCIFLSISRSYIALDDDAIEIRNFLPRRVRIQYADVRSINGGYQGIEIRTRQRRRRYYAWAVQDANLTRMLCNPTRSQAVIAEVLRRAPRAFSADMAR